MLFISIMIDNLLSWNVLLFSCYPIGLLCLGGPGYSSRTVNIHPPPPRSPDIFMEVQGILEKLVKVSKFQVTQSVTVIFALRTSILCGIGKKVHFSGHLSVGNCFS